MKSKELRIWDVSFNFDCIVFILFCVGSAVCEFEGSNYKQQHNITCKSRRLAAVDPNVKVNIVYTSCIFSELLLRMVFFQVKN